MTLSTVLFEHAKYWILLLKISLKHKIIVVLLILCAYVIQVLQIRFTHSSTVNRKNFCIITARKQFFIQLFRIFYICVWYWFIELMIHKCQIEFHIVANDWLSLLRNVLNHLTEPDFPLEQLFNLFFDLELFFLFIKSLFLFLLIQNF